MSDEIKNPYNPDGKKITFYTGKNIAQNTISACINYLEDACTNLKWIKDSIKKFQDQPRNAKRQYVSDEAMYIWGKQYFIKFVPNEQKNSFEIQGK